MEMLEGFALCWGSQRVGLCWRRAAELLMGQGLTGRGAYGRQHGGGICTVPTGEQHIPPGTGTGMGMVRGKARLRSPRG